jgi:NADP-dependent 3-hydroxy acid dehydrogenase YdfG
MKTVLITGATSGFGLSLARKLAPTHKLIITGRRKEKLEEVKAELEKHNPIHSLCFDISNSEALNKNIDSLAPEFSEIDILVNNAGLALGLEPADKADLKQWQQMIATNVSGLVEITHKVLPQMRERNSGHIINIGSIAGSWPYPGGNVYGATKAFVAQFSRNLRADLLGSGIRVCNIEPGLAETEFSIVRFEGDKDKAKKVYENLVPLYAQDIADAVHYVINCPQHVNINSMEIMPSCQAWGPLAVFRS